MSEIPMIPLGSLRLSQTASQIQRRQFFDKDGLEDLALSITSHGVLQPIIVRPLKVLSTPGLNGYRVAGEDYMSPDEAEAAARDRYEIIAGERRYLAAQKAGLEQIPANVLDVSDETVVEIQLIENLEREDVHPMHEAESYDELVHRWKSELTTAQELQRMSAAASPAAIPDKRSLLRQVWQKPVRVIAAGNDPYAAALYGVLLERRSAWPASEWAAACDELEASTMTVRQFLESEASR